MYYCKTKLNQTPWPQSASELHRPSDRRLPAKLVPTLSERGCHVVRVTDPCGRILGFLDRNVFLYLNVINFLVAVVVVNITCMFWVRLYICQSDILTIINRNMQRCTRIINVLLSCLCMHMPLHSFLLTCPIDVRSPVVVIDGISSVILGFMHTCHCTCIFTTLHVMLSNV
jgi:hypothetical protein